MIRAAALLSLALMLAACDAPSLTGVAAGVQDRVEAPTRPLDNPDHATFAFLPFEGVPGNTGDNLLRRLWTRMDREGLQVVKRPNGRALFTVEGTLTAVTDDNTALVFYVFDIHDVSGRRLHRISGQQRSNGSDNDPWSNVADRDLDFIARRTAALINAWLNARA